MNRIFQTLWNDLTQSFVAVGENTTRKGKRSGSSASADAACHSAGGAGGARRQPRIRMLALEQRIMFDGAALATVAESSPLLDDASHSSAPLLDAKTLAIAPTIPPTSAPTSTPATNFEVAKPDLTLSIATGHTTHQMVFVDTTLPNWQDLLGGLPQDAEVILLDPAKNGLTQITDTLAGRSDVTAVHLLTHGGEGYLVLGNTMLSSYNLADYQSSLASLGKSLAPGADVLLYGCDVALGDKGALFVNQLAQATGLDVAASTNDTGVKGDWVLEMRTGSIQTATLAVLDYGYDLATIKVTNLNDSGTGSLRAAVTTATGNNAADFIVFDPALFASGAQTITLTTGALNVGGTSNLDAFIIIGPGENLLTISGNNSSRVFSADSYTSRNTSSLSISGMTITAGRDASTGYSGGGAVFSYYSGNLTLDHVRITNSTSLNGTGGGVRFSGPGSSNFILRNSTVSGNTATGSASYGGGVEASTFSGNLYIGNSTISGNTSYRGGGGVRLSGQVGSSATIVNATISGNTSNSTGFNGTAGGGLFLATNTASVTNSTITGNRANTPSNVPSSFDGGGVGTSNVALTLKNTIIANNTVGSGVAGRQNLVLGQNVTATGSNNLIANTFVYSSSTNSLTGTITTGLGTLGTLAYNGGSVKTISIATGSTAINAGTTTGAPANDARGYGRGATVDIGAYEFSDNNLISFGGVVSPANGVIDVPSSYDLSIDFGVAVSGVAGKNINIYQSNGMLFETIAANSGLVTFGTGTGGANSKVTINPAGTFASLTGYYVQIDSGAFITSASDNFAGISSISAWAFTSVAAAADTTPPTVSSIAITSATGILNNTLNAGDVVSVTVTMSEATNVMGTPQLELNIGGTLVQASYFSGTGTTALVFRYTVLAGQTDTNGISIAANRLTLNGGTLKDAAGNNATLTHVLVADNANFLVDTTAPTATIATTAFSADTGTSNTDFITRTAAQTISGTVSANMVAGELVEVSLNNGATWTTATTTVGANTWSLAGQTLTASNTLRVRVSDTAGNNGTTASQAYVLDTTAPVVGNPVLAAASDSGSSNSDRITNVTTPTITGTAAANSSVTLYDTDGTTVLGTANANGAGAWSITSSTLTSGAHTLTAKATDAAGNTSAASSGLSITIDTTAPVFASAAVNGNQLVMTYTEANTLDATNKAATTAFAVVSGGSANAVTAVTVNAAAKTVTLTLTTAVTQGQAVTVAYTDPTAGNDANATQDAAGNDAITLAATAVTNNTPDTTAPVLANATVNGNQLVLTYTEANTLDATNAPATSAFAVVSGGSSNAVTAVAVNATAKTVTLTLATAVTPGQQVTVAYTDPTASDDANAIQDSAGNDAASIQAIAFNTTRPNTAPTFATVVGTGKVVTDIGTNTSDFGQSVTVQADGKLVVAGYTTSGGSSNFAVVRYNADGSLDTSFNAAGATPGKVIIDIGTNTNDAAQSVTVQADGKLVVAGNTDSGGSNNFAVVRYNADGSLDTSFNAAGTTPGKLVTDIGANTNDQGGGITVQADGKLVVAGFTNNGDPDFAVVRYNADGSLDTSFNAAGTTPGKLVTDIGANTNDQGRSITVQADGKLVVAGYTNSGGFSNFCVVRYNADGSLDTSFNATGTPGKLITDIGTNSGDFGQSVTVQADGKLVVAGYTNIGGSNNNFAVVRYNADGSLDTSFNAAGTPGKVVIDIGTNTADFGQSVTLQADGKLVVAGYTDSGGSNNFAVVRYNADGSLDTSFNATGTPGKLITDIGTNSGDFGQSVTVQADGKLVVAGGTNSGGSNNFAVVRYNANGSLDTSFGGTATNTLGGTVTYNPGGAAIALDSSVAVFDAELAALASGAGNYNGTSVTLARSGGAAADDVFSALGNLSFSSGNVVLSGTTVGTFTNAGGTLTISFNANATQVRINSVLSSIGYANSSATPPASVQIGWTFIDGNTGSQGVGNNLQALGTSTVNIPDTTAPVFANATVNSNQLVMTYTDISNLNAVNVPATSAFAVVSGGSSNAVTAVSVNATAKTVTLTLTTAVTQGQAVTVAYADPTVGNDANAIQDAAGNDAVTLTATAVTNNTPDTTAPVLANAVVNGNQLVLTYTEANTLDATNAPATSAFAVVSGGSSNAVTAVAVNATAKTVTLTLATAVTPGQQVTGLTPIPRQATMATPSRTARAMTRPASRPLPSTPPGPTPRLRLQPWWAPARRSLTLAPVHLMKASALPYRPTASWWWRAPPIAAARKTSPLCATTPMAAWTPASTLRVQHPARWSQTSAQIQLSKA
jgi:uncharacterized delta-60 repeat protein/uncharacterized repeat protein (TIGR02059 family)